MPKPRKNRSPRPPRNQAVESLPGGKQMRPVRFIGTKTLRVIGGDLRRRGVTYNGDRATRPMKDSVRENLFNILGKGVQGTIAWDLFAGTGILAIEAISRGALRAVAIDASRGCTSSIRQSCDALGISDRVEILQGDTFRLTATRAQYTPPERRTVFCCPPYQLWETERESLVKLLETISQGATPGSLIVSELERKTDPEFLPGGPWDVRHYGNVTLAVKEIA